MSEEDRFGGEDGNLNRLRLHRALRATPGILFYVKYDENPFKINSHK